MTDHTIAELQTLLRAWAEAGDPTTAIATLAASNAAPLSQHLHAPSPASAHGRVAAAEAEARIDALMRVLVDQLDQMCAALATLPILAEGPQVPTALCTLYWGGREGQATAYGRLSLRDPDAQIVLDQAQWRRQRTALGARPFGAIARALAGLCPTQVQPTRAFHRPRPDLPLWQVWTDSLAQATTVRAARPEQVLAYIGALHQHAVLDPQSPVHLAQVREDAPTLRAALLREESS